MIRSDSVLWSANAVLEALEPRRLLAAGSFGPGQDVDAPMEKPTSGYYSYELTQGALEWSVTTDVGVHSGITFRLKYDETAPSHPDDVGPDLDAQLARIVADLRTFDTDGDVPADAEFYVRTNSDGTVSFVRFDTSPVVNDGNHGWGHNLWIDGVNGQQVLHFTGAVGSGSIQVTFDDLFTDEHGRLVLRTLQKHPGMGTCDMKYYAHSVALPEGYAGEIVLRTTQERSNIDGSSSTYETEIVFHSDDLLVQGPAPVPKQVRYTTGPDGSLVPAEVPASDEPVAPAAPTGAPVDEPSDSTNDAPRVIDSLFSDESLIPLPADSTDDDLRVGLLG